jgi:2,4-dienoyl-CoA reductase-like NADH-dependent reductase (Old Yellow Enzyme family)
VFAAVRKVFDGPLGMRVSATDWVEGGWDLAQTTAFACQLKALGCDFIHVSSAGVSPLQKITVGPAFQVPFASAVRKASGLATTAVGLITQPQQAEDILQAGDADLIALARALLYKPRWPWEAATALGGQVTASAQYWRCMPREAQTIFGNVKMGQR